VFKANRKVAYIAVDKDCHPPAIGRAVKENIIFFLELESLKQFLILWDELTLFRRD
jgi:hypothetical protein